MRGLALLVVGAALLGGCVTTTSRLEVLGVVEELPPPPPPGQEIMEVPIDPQAHLPPEAPVISRHGQRFLVVLVDRRAHFIATDGEVLPAHIWSGPAQPGPAPALGASVALEHATAELQALHATVERLRADPRAQADLRGTVASLDEMDATLARIADTLAARVVREERMIPDPNDPAIRIPLLLHAVSTHMATIRVKIALMRDLGPADPAVPPPHVGPHDVPPILPLDPRLGTLFSDLERLTVAVDDALATGNIAMAVRSSRDLFLRAQDIMHDPVWWRLVAGPGTDADRNRRWTMQRQMVMIRELSAESCSILCGWVVAGAQDQTMPTLVAPY